MIRIKINNGREMRITQMKEDDKVVVTTGVPYERFDAAFCISPGDMVLLIDYYRHKKDCGEAIL